MADSALLTKTYPLISNPTEYWLGLLGAVLSCLHDHKLLEHRPDKYGLPREAWSLRDFRGQAPHGALGYVKASMANWGFQYLLVDVLNDKSLPYMNWLQEGLSQVKGTDLDLLSANAVAHVSGTDAYSAHDLAGRVRGRLLSDLRKTFATSQQQVRNTDLCVVLEGAREYPVIALGEVEGVHGGRVTSPAFWAAKSPATNFGIGVVEGEGVRVELVETSVGQRFVMLFGSRMGLARDFLGALDWMDYLVREGPHHRQRERAEPGLKEALDYIASRFTEPVSAILGDLHGSVFTEQRSQILLLDSTGAAPSAVHTPDLLIVGR